ncbi:MAG: exodeoxyribonuclease VII large subunit [Deltaproteobacteria bacterium]|nr:exodeoxyribonuclease VII large subunit [Deltaproteobacteria bacterium]
MHNRLLSGKGKIYTVCELTNYISKLLNENVGYVYVRGEVSNLRISDAGHAYFTIKDERSQLSAVLFRGQNIKIMFKDGSRIIAGGMVTVYPVRGVYQIVVNEVMIDGQGELYLRFEELKKRLYEKGLFSEEIKKILPDYPFHIGLITSPYGAAVRDFLKTALNKNPFVKISVYPARVQGEGAAKEIISGIRYFNKKREADVIAIIRGGGSFEDLFCFNDEELAYAIRESNIPVVTGIGHEIDFTIADYAADLRAATPTAAAESSVRSFSDMIDEIREKIERIDSSVADCVNKREMIIRRFLRVFYRDKEKFDKKTELLNIYVEKMKTAIGNFISDRYDRINRCNTLIERYSPVDMLRRYSEKLSLIDLRQKGAILKYFETLDNRIKESMTKLELTNPENILKKGYSLVLKGDKIVSDSEQILIDDVVSIRFYRGTARAEIKDKSR